MGGKRSSEKPHMLHAHVEQGSVNVPCASCTPFSHFENLNFKHFLVGRLEMHTGCPSSNATLFEVGGVAVVSASFHALIRFCLSKLLRRFFLNLFAFLGRNVQFAIGFYI